MKRFLHTVELPNIQEFVHVYREARTLYTAGNWVRSAEKMEQALQLYLQV